VGGQACLQSLSPGARVGGTRRREERGRQLRGPLELLIRKRLDVKHAFPSSLSMFFIRGELTNRQKPLGDGDDAGSVNGWV